MIKPVIKGNILSLYSHQISLFFRKDIQKQETNRLGWFL